MSRRLTDKEEIAYWLALLRAPDVGPVTYLALLEHYGDPRSVFEARGREFAARGRMRAATIDYLSNPGWAAVERDLAWLEQPDHHVVTIADPAYPLLLREINDPPPVLFVNGALKIPSGLQLAIVGSRNPSPDGRENAYEFARHLAQGGITITSGLAIGIDAASHQGALAGHGYTVAVAGTGLDRIYPARHHHLSEAISGQGAVVSEFPIGTGPLAANFPRRNRIISGLSVGTLVVEAALRSGSLITARKALEQGREVFAIPGSIHNPLARGCHSLLRQGAKLVESIQDIVEELGPLSLAALTPGDSLFPVGVDTPELDCEQEKVLQKLGFDPTSIDTLVERTGLTAESLSPILLALELQGCVMSVPGGAYIRHSARK